MLQAISQLPLSVKLQSDRWMDPGQRCWEKIITLWTAKVEKILLVSH
jgi:hypothetical protein